MPPRSRPVRNAMIPRLVKLREKLVYLMTHLISIESGYEARIAASIPANDLERRKNHRSFEEHDLKQAREFYGGAGYYWDVSVLDTPRESLKYLVPWMRAMQGGVAAILYLLESKKDLSQHRDVLSMVAKTQAAVRVAANRAGLPVVREQEEMFHILDDLASEYGRIAQWMRIGDVPNYTDLADAHRHEIELHGLDRRWIDRLKRQIRTSAQALRGMPANGESDVHHWRMLSAGVGALVRGLAEPGEYSMEGLTPKAAERIVRERWALFFEALQPSIPFPADLPRDRLVDSTYDTIMAAMARIACAPAPEPTPVATNTRLSPTSKAVAKALAGSTVLLLAGECNEPARLRLQQELSLADLQWPTMRQHSTSPAQIAALIRPGGFRLVILASGFADHSMSALREVCKSAGVAFVQLPANAGYGTNTLSRHVAEQAGETLGIA